MLNLPTQGGQWHGVLRKVYVDATRGWARAGLFLLFFAVSASTAHVVRMPHKMWLSTPHLDTQAHRQKVHYRRRGMKSKTTYT
jgi:hypothetical protein